METAALLNVDNAVEEVMTVPPATLHRNAALSWGTRAVASYRVCTQKASLQESLSYFYLGEHYREAALAHAAMGEQWQDLGAEIEGAMATDRASAFATMRRFSSETASTSPLPQAGSPPAKDVKVPVQPGPRRRGPGDTGGPKAR